MWSWCYCTTSSYIAMQLESQFFSQDNWISVEYDYFEVFFKSSSEEGIILWLCSESECDCSVQWSLQEE